MAMSISFAWTTPALIARLKTVTRRDWDDGYARRFGAGMVVDALDRDRRYGGVPVAKLRLTEDAHRDRYPGETRADWQAEGIPWLVERGLAPRGLPQTVEGYLEWASAGLVVVRFRLEEVLPAAARVMAAVAQKMADRANLPLFQRGEGRLP